MRPLSLIAAILVSSSLAVPAAAQPAEEPEPDAAPTPAEPEQAPPADARPAPAPDALPPPEPEPPPTVEPPAESEPEPELERMSEGRMLVSLYHSGFQWGISPGVVFSRGKAGFFLGLRFGYGFDTGSVILVPGLRLAGYFTDPNVYVGMPTFKLVLPIDRFAPFVEGGAGAGHVAKPQETGVALMGGGGFTLHFSRIAFGAEASYQVITGTQFAGFSVGPILAIGF